MKLGRTGKFIPRGIVSTLAVEWIEIYNPILVISFKMSPPSRWSGLKLDQLDEFLMGLESPPSRWSGLKFGNWSEYRGALRVSTLAVEWIEITSLCQY